MKVQQFKQGLKSIENEVRALVTNWLVKQPQRCICFHRML